MIYAIPHYLIKTIIITRRGQSSGASIIAVVASPALVVILVAIATIVIVAFVASSIAAVLVSIASDERGVIVDFVLGATAPKVFL